MELSILILVGCAASGWVGWYIRGEVETNRPTPLPTPPPTSHALRPSHQSHQPHPSHQSHPSGSLFMVLGGGKPVLPLAAPYKIEPFLQPPEVNNKIEPPAPIDILAVQQAKKAIADRALAHYRNKRRSRERDE